jgi:hypothetical protein
LKIYCLLVSGLPLSEEMCDALHKGARRTVRTGKSRRKIRGSNFEGRVETTNEYVSLGTIAGVYFTGIVESNTFVTKVRFIVRTADLEGLDDAVWVLPSDSTGHEFSSN